MLKKVVLIIVTIALFVSSFSMPEVQAADEPSNWAKENVAKAIKNGFVPQRLQSNYQKPITREEFASLFVQTVFAIQKLKGMDRNGNYDSFFTDCAVTREEVLRQVKVTDYSFKDTDSEDVKLAYILGFVEGTSATTFSPHKPITRQEAAVMLTKYGSPEAYGISCKEDLEHFMPRYVDFNKTDKWAKDALNLAFYRGVFAGTTGDDEWSGTSKITLDPKGYFTREQAIVIAQKLYRNDKTSVPIDLVYLRGCLIFNGDAIGVNWEVTKTSLTAVSLTKEEKIAQSGEYTYSTQFLKKYYSSEFPNGFASPEALIASFPRAGAARPQLTRAAMRELGAGKNVIYDLGFAEYEGNNPNYVFQFRFKNNGFYTNDTYGGSKLIPIPCKKLK